MDVSCGRRTSRQSDAVNMYCGQFHTRCHQGEGQAQLRQPNLHKDFLQKYESLIDGHSNDLITNSYLDLIQVDWNIRLKIQEQFLQADSLFGEADD